MFFVKADIFAYFSDFSTFTKVVIELGLVLNKNMKILLSVGKVVFFKYDMLCNVKNNDSLRLHTEILKRLLSKINTCF